MARDINAHSPIWNSHCNRRQNATILEELIEQFEPLINSKPGRATRPSSREVLVIDLALSTVELVPLILWEIPEKYPSLSDHELIVLRWEDMDYVSMKQNCGGIISWDIQGFINGKTNLQAAQSEWMKQIKSRSILDSYCTRQKLNKKVQWVETLFTYILNIHIKSMRVTLFSKRWWNKEVAGA